MKYTTVGVSASGTNVRIYFEEEGPGWLRFGSVVVNAELLLQEDVVDALDRATRRRLIEAWSEVDIADSLF